MREFFKGWRRMVGCVALVLALTLMAGWIRSFRTEDIVLVPLSWHGRYITMDSIRGEVELELCRSNKPSGSASFQTWPLKPDDESRPESFRFFMFDTTSGGTFDHGGTVISSYLIAFRYSVATIPLTLLSAYLLLCKPRKRRKAN